MKILFFCILLLCTPLCSGASQDIRTTDIQSICTTHTKEFRNVSLATKKQVYANAGVKYSDRNLCKKGYEVDHRVSLEVGGSNDISNLQLQAYCTFDELAKDKAGVPLYKGLYDARKKDGVENNMKSQICSGKTTPEAAQQLLKDWKN